MGGCIATATTASAVCVFTNIFWVSDTYDIHGYSAGWATTTVFAAAVAASAPTTNIAVTAITVATNYLAVPSTCITVAAVTNAAC
jgi:hypothetical protein